VVIINDYTIVDNNYYQDYAYLDQVIKKTLSQQKVKKVSFAIIFVDEGKIRELNEHYRHQDKVTDVISFAFEDNEKKSYNEWRLLGEIYICIPQMQKQAVKYKTGEQFELSFLVVHGLLHLLGYDHQTITDEQEMIRLQELILNASNIKG